MSLHCPSVPTLYPSSPKPHEDNHGMYSQTSTDASLHSVPDSIVQIKNSLRDLTGESWKLFMDALCQGFMNTGDYSQISNILSEVQRLESRVRMLHWQYVGHLDDPTKGTFDQIHLLSSILEDLLINAMEGADVAQMYTRRNLLFQQYLLDNMY